MADSPKRSWTRLKAPHCLLGEGPTYDRHADTAWWFDILGRRLFEHRFADGVTRTHTLPEQSSALARVDADRQLLLTETGLYLRQVDVGGLVLHCPVEADNPLTRSNDARVHPCGAFWVSTMGRAAQEGAGAIHWYFRGETRKLFAGISIPNAICFSPDGRIGYYADSATKRMMHVPVDPENGLPQAEPQPFGSVSKDGEPDGAVTDRQGNLWVARWGGGGLQVLAADGTLKRQIDLPVSQPTCPVFVGPAFDRLLVTSASMDLPPEAPDAGLAGATFLLDLGAATGKPEPDVRID